MLMAAITPTEAQAYFKRWELVKEIELPNCAALPWTSNCVSCQL
jgi:hypothetical protein